MHAVGPEPDFREELVAPSPVLPHRTGRGRLMCTEGIATWHFGGRTGARPIRMHRPVPEGLSLGDVKASRP